MLMVSGRLRCCGPGERQSIVVGGRGRGELSVQGSWAAERGREKGREGTRGSPSDPNAPTTPTTYSCHHLPGVHSVTNRFIH